jgi:hypothetical protein
MVRTPPPSAAAAARKPEMVFEGYPDAAAIFAAVKTAVAKAGGGETKVGKSQIAFRRDLAFAWVWRPGRYLRGKVAPLVVSIRLGRRDASTRWKQIFEPYPGRFMHHLELRSREEVDGEVQDWLTEARGLAVKKPRARRADSIRDLA